VAACAALYVLVLPVNRREYIGVIAKVVASIAGHLLRFLWHSNVAAYMVTQGESSGLPTETHFHIGAFDRAAELQPTRHVFAEEHLPWFPIGD
jgi:hypothetical protein